MVIEIKYSSFTAKLEQALKDTFNDKYNYIYYNEKERKFEQLAVPYEDNLSNIDDYTSLIEMMEDIIDLPYAIKQAHDAKPSDIHQILLLNMKDIFLLDNILKNCWEKSIKA